MATPQHSPSPSEQKPSQAQSSSHTTKLDPPKSPFGIAIIWFVLPILLIVLFKCS